MTSFLEPAHLLEPLQFAFFNRAILGVILVAALTGAVGVYVVLRGLTYIGDAMAHAVFPGVVGAYLLRLNLLVGALAAAVITAFAIAGVARQRVRQDSAIAIVFVGMFALGVMLLSRAKTYKADLENFLVGNPLAVSNQDLLAIAGLATVVMLVLLLLQKELTLVAFDETEARVVGLPVELLNNILLLLIAFSVVLAIQMVGTVLVVSLLVTSSTTARMFGLRVGPTMMLAAAVGACSGVLGLFLSYHLSVAPGATIVLVNTAVFLLLLMLKRKTNQ